MSSRSRVVRSVVAGALSVVALAGWAAAPPATAATHAVTGQHQYTCQIAQSNKPSKKPIMTSSMQLSMQLAVPASVQPGQRLSLRGTMSLQFPEELATYGKTLVDTANGFSDTMSVALTLNGRTTVLRADRWQSPNVKVENPLIVRAPVSFPAITVPSGSTGSIKLAMPRDGVLKNPYFATPSAVAFTAAAQAHGALLNADFYLACAGASTTPTFATIPIGSTAGSQGMGRPGTPNEAAGGASEAPGSDPAAVADDPFGGNTAQTGVATGPGEQLVDGSLTAGTPQTGQGIYVPAGVLIVIGVVVCLAALAFAGWTQYRLTALRASLDD